MKHIFKIFFALQLLFLQQLIAQSNIVVNTTESGNPLRIARDMVDLKPGFNYKPLAGQVGDYKIDQSVVGDASYSGGSNPSVDISKRNINTQCLVGLMQGAASVSGSGGASYSIPLSIPSGLMGMSPSLSVNYSSQSGNGLFGMGWNLSCPSSISRSGQTIYHNGEVQGVSLTNSDVFVLDGARLIPISGSNGATGTIYATEHESFSRVTSLENSATGPLRFTVETKDGKKMEYGTVAGARLIASNSEVICWYIQKVTDLNGNYIQYNYRNENGEILLDEITYSGHTSTGLSPYNKVKFYYTSRTDKYSMYIVGNEIKKNVLIDKVKAYSSDLLFKEYQFSYSLKTNSFLSEVTEFGADGSRFNSTAFQYGDKAPDMSYSFLTQIARPNVTIYTGDYTGDGVSDVLEATYSIVNDIKYHNKIDLYEGNTSGVFSTLPIASQALPAGYGGSAVSWDNGIPISANVGQLNADFDGDGKNDFLITDLYHYPDNNYSNVQNIKIYCSKGNNFTLKSYSADPYSGNMNTPVADNQFLHIGDFNGDGAMDFITLLAGSNLNSFKALIRFPAISDIAKEILFDFSSDVINGNRFYVTDFDGDGKNELMSVGIKTSVYEFLNSGSSLTMNSVTLLSLSSFPTKSQDIYVGDYNGDGKTDLITKATSGLWQISYSNGVNFITSSIDIGNPDLSDVTKSVLLIGDYNGDGKSDVNYIYNPSDGSPSQSIVRYSTNTGFTTPVVHLLSAQHTLASLHSGDFNGDGNLDEIHYNSGYNIETILYNPESKETLLKKIADGFNNISEFVYSSMTKNTVYTKTTSYTFPFQNISLPINLVSALRLPDGNGGIAETTFKYEDAILHRFGKGFLGFLKQTSSNSITGIRQTLVNELNSTYCVLMPFAQNTLLLSNNSYIGGTSNNYTYVSLGGKRFNVLLTGAYTTNDLQNTFISVGNQYDVYGNNIKSITYFGVPENPAQAVNQIESVYGTYGTWIPSSPVSITNTAVRIIEGESSYVRKTTLSYDNKGNMLIQIIDPGDTKQVTDTYVYNSFGQVVSQNTSATGVDAIVKSIQYDNKGFAVRQYNALGQFEEFTRDGFGRIIKSQDIIGHITEYQYDGFNRVLKTVYPNGIESTSVLVWDIRSGNNSDLSNVSTSYYSLTNTCNSITKAITSPSIQTWFDSFGRDKIQKADVERATYGNRLYDSKGNTRVTTLPYFSGDTPIKTVNTFDDLNRITKTEIDGITPATTFTYTYNLTEGKLSTKIISPQGTTTKIVDATGKLISVTDDGGTVVYSYYSSGDLKSVLLAGQKLETLTYDLQGNKRGLVDKNAGTISYSYDAFGRLMSQTENGKVTTVTYDVVGRMLSKTTSEGITSFEYYSSGAAINKIKKITGLNGNFEQYDYTTDFGRLQKVTKQIGSESFSTQYEYSSIGLQTKVIYPSGYIVKNHYSTKGEMDKLIDNSETKTIWEKISRNANGQYTQCKLGNGLTTTTTYDAYGFYKSFKAGTIWDLQMDFNTGTGNLNYRKDNLLNLTENFTYDNVNRLKSAQVNLLTPLTIDYANNGNITKKSDVGDYTYDATKNNAVSLVSNPQNISSLQQDIQYTSFDKAKCINEGGVHEVTISYGVDDERSKSIVKENGVETLTRYYLSGYEKSVEPNGNKTELTYISSPDGLVAIHVKENGAGGQLYYVYSDHLGTPVVITDSTGSVVYKQSFDAWGRRRNPNTWDYDLTSYTPAQPKWMYRGYTGHEMLPQFALINMNGRIYDPILGRMLSPDNYIQDAGFSQNYNRYSYVWNNPLKYNDPTGKWILDAIAMTVGGGINLALNWNKLSGSPWDKFVKGAEYFAVGAIAGEVALYTGGAALAAAGGTGVAAVVAGGVAAGGAGGLVSGAITGVGNAIIDKKPAGDIFAEGVKGGVLGGVSGMAFGGVGAWISTTPAAQSVGKWLSKVFSKTPKNEWPATEIIAPAKPLTPYNSSFQTIEKLEPILPEKVYYYAAGDLGERDFLSREATIYLTNNPDLTPVSAQIDLALNKIPRFRAEIRTNSANFDPSKIDIIRRVNGNVNGTGGGGWEIIYKGPLPISDSYIKITQIYNNR